MPNDDSRLAPPLPDLGAIPLNGFCADGITLKTVIHDGIVSRTYAGHTDQGQVVRVWIAGDLLARDTAFMARLEQESANLATLHHVHLETCLGHHRWNVQGGRQVVALVEEASAGVSLGELIRREALPVRDVLRLFHQVASGLAAAHRIGIVHGDITPDAILVTTGGAAKLRSFALGISGYSADRTERSLIGAPDFMAPEVGRGQQPSSLSDLYALGAVLATALIGDTPYVAATALETIHRHASAPVPDLAVSHPEFSLVAPLVARLMAKDPAQRWIDVEDLARDLLLLSSQVPSDLCCRIWSGRHPAPLATLVQNALTSRRDGSAPPALEKPRASGATTSITRNSTEVFRNPEMFKPTGLTPAGGLPVVPATSQPRPSTRTVRRLAEAAPSGSSAPAPTPAVASSAPPKAPSYLSQLASLPAPSTPPGETVTATPARSRTLPIVVSLVALVVVVGGVLITSAMRGAAAKPVAVPLASASVASTAPSPEQALSKRIADIRALARSAPQSALREAAVLRREQPKADLASLPLALRLDIQGPASASVAVSHAGETVAMQDGVLCRARGEAMSLHLTARGYRPYHLEVPASADEEATLRVVMQDEPRWEMPAFAPSWARVLQAPGGVLLASDRKVVLVQTGDGHEICRLDHQASPLLPENLTWTSLLSVEGERLRLGLAGGLCVETQLPGFSSVSELHRGASSVIALCRLPLTLRLGEEGIFLIERDGAGFVLAADSRERRLWSRPLRDAQMPWLVGESDHLVVVGERQAQRFSQEGEAGAVLIWSAARTAEPVLTTGAGILVPTGDGVIRLQAKTSRLDGSEGAVAGLLVSGEVVVAACGRGLVAWRNIGGDLTPLWRCPDLIATDRRAVHLGQGAGQVVLVDDAGVMQVCALADGAVNRTVRTGAPILAPPLVIDRVVVTVHSSGVVAAY